MYVAQIKVCYSVLECVAQYRHIYIHIFTKIYIYIYKCKNEVLYSQSIQTATKQKLSTCNESSEEVIYIHMYIFEYIHIYSYIFINICTYIYVCVYTYVHIYIHVYISIYINPYVCG